MAIKVYTDKGSVDKEKFINDAGTYFNINIKPSEITSIDKEVIKRIDNGTFVDEEDIKTPFGTTSMYNLSSGTKTIISILHHTEKIFNLINCGENALKVLFELIDGTDIQVFLDHTSYDASNIGMDLKFDVNNKDVETDAMGLYLEIDKYRD